MDFNLDDFSSLLPPELTRIEKGRLNDALRQFHSSNTRTKYYTDFYSTKEYPYFLQGDLLKELRFPEWNMSTHTYDKVYHDVILLSNTCDMDDSNIRDIPKQVMIAKLISLDSFIEALRRFDLEIVQIIDKVKNQQYTNLIYLPASPNYNESIVYLDEISWISIDELKDLKKEIKENRIVTLDHFGYYLFIFKLSFHFNRLPESPHR